VNNHFGSNSFRHVHYPLTGSIRIESDAYKHRSS
jgi:hypothetical protein